MPKKITFRPEERFVSGKICDRLDVPPMRPIRKLSRGFQLPPCLFDHESDEESLREDVLRDEPKPNLPQEPPRIPEPILRNGKHSKTICLRGITTTFDPPPLCSDKRRDSDDQSITTEYGEDTPLAQKHHDSISNLRANLNKRGSITDLRQLASLHKRADFDNSIPSVVNIEDEDGSNTSIPSNSIGSLTLDSVLQSHLNSIGTLSLDSVLEIEDLPLIPKE